MKTTIFTRILTATLIPVLIALIVLIGTARNVIYRDGIAYTGELVRMAAERISEKTADKLESAAVLQNDISVRLSTTNFTRTYAADSLLLTLIMANRDIYSVWFAFEEGIFPTEGRYFKTLIRGENGITEIFDMSEEQLSDPEQSPWYNVPLRSGFVYADMNDFYDFQVGEGAIHIFTMTYPIFDEQGKVIGCVGLDMRYEDLFTLDETINDRQQNIMLTNPMGEVIYSTRAGDVGGTLFDCGLKDMEHTLSTTVAEGVWQGETNHNGETLLVCLYPIEIQQTGQTIFLYRDIPAASLYSTFYSSMDIIIVVGTLGMILLAFCVFLSTRSIVRHVKRITDSFYHVAGDGAEGTLSGEHIPIRQTYIHELDTLQAALISMISQLRKAHELKLKAVEAEVEREKLVASAETKTNFFASMSHEIRTPMNAIHGIAEILLFEGDLSPAQEKHINDIRMSSDALLRIVNDILDISRLETGKLELRPDHYSFRSLIDNISSLADQLASNDGLQFIFRPEGELPSSLFGDEARLRQVLINLIGNAIKFTREGYVMLRVVPRGGSIRFDVVDTGIGIKEDQAQAIFEAFKQVDTRRNRSITGTGLGLSISRNIVELMGGHISVKSVYGEGSTFSITVPLIPGDESKIRANKPKSGIRFADTLRVLIVDDNEINLSVSSGLFRAAHGIRCDTALSGKEAIQKVQEIDYDIIFMDHMMPEMDGVDTTKYIRGLGGKFEAVPIIALTANAVSGTRQELLSEGMNDFLAKPIQSNRLQAILEAWVPDDKKLVESTQNTDFSEEIAPQIENMQEPDIEMPYREILEAEGIDVSTGIENVGFNEETYLRSLRLLEDRLPALLDVMREMVSQENCREFMIQVHGLKGSLSSVGAVSYAADAQILEDAANENDIGSIEELLPPFAESIQSLHGLLEKALPAAASSAEVGATGLCEALRKLCAALESYDYDSINNELKVILSILFDAETDKKISQMRQLIDSFEYPAAVTLIREELLHEAEG